MLYVKYRPRNVDELDNTHVREQLQKLLKAKDMPHAFLFAGPKGTGKTSTARILAKALNGAENEEAIAKGTSPDVIEIDAASHRKIDDIRDLISQLKFAPLVSKYKVFIIDEVHMLTKEAFNALLKSLEEPPASTIFVLATTDPDALPRTISSRCMLISFPAANISDIMSMLQRMLTGEGTTVSDEVCAYIARYADGSFRDAAKMLELALIQGVTSVDELKTLFGRSWDTGDVLPHVEAGDVKVVLEWIEQNNATGTNFRLLIEDMLQTLHAQLLKKNKIEVADTAEYTFSTKEVARLISLLHTAYAEMKTAPIHALPLEIALLTFMHERSPNAPIGKKPL